MPEAATTEFWKDIKPVPNSFKPGVLPEVYMKDPANSDERYFVPVSETVSGRGRSGSRPSATCGPTY